MKINSIPPNSPLNPNGGGRSHKCEKCGKFINKVEKHTGGDTSSYSKTTYRLVCECDKTEDNLN